MNFFLSSITSGPATSRWRPLEQEFSQKLSLLKDSFYGDELTEICIISIILPEEFLEEEGWRERKLFHRKTQDADIRLKIDYRSFVYTTPEKRRALYKRHIIDSILTLKNKVSKAYQFEQLLADVESALG